MNITYAKKIINHMNNEWESIQATINGVEVFVPLDTANADYAAIMELVNAGELTIAEADA